jgi:hypothetical protein
MRLIFVLIFIQFLNSICAQDIDIKRIKKHIVYLSSDELKGRGTSSNGEKKAAKYIAKQFKKMKLNPVVENKSFFHDFSFSHFSNPHDTLSKETRSGRNVMAFLDNGAEYTIVIGAHFDHLGLGFDHNSLAANAEGEIHNGADDNASGTAAVIELARVFAGNNVKEKYNFLFTCFSAEELGLFGSKKMLESDVFDWKKVNYMINMDMIGRFNDSSKSLMVGGFGTSSAWDDILYKTTHNFKIKIDSSGIGPSDHTSFYLKNIPVLFFFTGQHKDYHKPSDDWDKINYKGEKEIIQFIYQIINLSFEHNKLDFLPTRIPLQTKSNFKVTLGIMPDYTFEAQGVRIDGVTEGKPASRAKLKSGDIILILNKTTIQNMQDYMKALSTCNKGETYFIQYQRGNEILQTTITF